MYAVAGWAVFFTTALESIAIGWMYGADKYWLEVEKMLGKHRLKQWLKIVWKYIAPFLCTVSIESSLHCWKCRNQRSVLAWFRGRMQSVD